MHPFVLFWLVLSVLALGMLSVSGAAAMSSRPRARGRAIT